MKKKFKDMFNSAIDTFYIVVISIALIFLIVNAALFAIDVKHEPAKQFGFQAIDWPDMFSLDWYGPAGDMEMMYIKPGPYQKNGQGQCMLRIGSGNTSMIMYVKDTMNHVYIDSPFEGHDVHQYFQFDDDPSTRDYSLDHNQTDFFGETLFNQLTSHKTMQIEVHNPNVKKVYKTNVDLTNAATAIDKLKLCRAHILTQKK